jgi:hypothetical protein
MYGNNLEATYIRHIRIPLFDQQKQTGNGVRYFFPENPSIDNKTIVGLEAHLLGSVLPPASAGDFRVDQFGLNNVIPVTLARYIYLGFYSDSDEEIFYNVPLVSLFGKPSLVRPKDRIHAYLGKIKCRKCYAYVPANSPITLNGQFFIDLTFYLK